MSSLSISTSRADSPPLPNPANSSSKKKFTVNYTALKDFKEEPSSPVNVTSLSIAESKDRMQRSLPSVSSAPIFNEGERRILAVFQKILNLPSEVTDIPAALLQELEDAKELEKKLATATATATAVEDPLEEALDAAEKISNHYFQSLKLLEISQAYFDRGELDKAGYLTNLTLEALRSITDPELQVHIFELAKKIFQKIKATREAKASLFKA